MTEVVSQDLLFTRLPPNFIQVHKKAHQMLHSKGSVRVLDPPRRQNRRFWSKSTATKGQTPFSVAQAKRFRLVFSGTTPRGGARKDQPEALCLCNGKGGLAFCGSRFGPKSPILSSRGVQHPDRPLGMQHLVGFFVNLDEVWWQPSKKQIL